MTLATNSLLGTGGGDTIHANVRSSDPTTERGPGVRSTRARVLAVWLGVAPFLSTMVPGCDDTPSPQLTAGEAPKSPASPAATPASPPPERSGEDCPRCAVELPPGSHPQPVCNVSATPSYEPSPEQVERDQIYQLVAYAVVYKDWQPYTWRAPPKQSPARGYNIGSVLVDTEAELGDQLVCWGRNSVIVTRNMTQHGEVRLITNYLSNSRSTSLKRHYALYTTLEPCAMCGGMMTVQSLPRTIYGQTDLGFGDGLQRLQVDTHEVGGFCSYPRGVHSTASTLPIRQEIDDAYAAWLAEGKTGLTSWLVTDEAKVLYAKATEQLEEWAVQHEVNLPVKQDALEFLAQVPADYAPLPHDIACGDD
jgi:tRNA(adenine34) deaminase